MPTCLTNDLSATRYDLHTPLPAHIKVLNALVVALPFIGFALAIVYLWGWGLGWLHLGIFVAMVTCTSLGVTIGFHRLFTHKSFETSSTIKFILGILGSMSVEGPVIKWSVIHRHHHQHSDCAEDAHSPYHHGDEHGGAFAGLWYSHIGWLFRPDLPDLSKYAKDLVDDPVTRFVSRYFAMWVFLGITIPAAIGGVATGTWMGAALAPCGEVLHGSSLCIT